MTDDKLDLITTLESQDWSGSLAELDQASIQEYLLSRLAGDDVTGFYLDGEAGAYPSIAWNLRIILFTGRHLYEFLFSPTISRYDINFLKDIYRLEERIDTEESVAGPPRTKVSLSLGIQSPLGLTLELSSYEEAGQRLSSFIAVLKNATWR